MTTTPPIVPYVEARAEQRLVDRHFLETWERLCAACSWSTAFQRPGFVTSWYRSYAELYSPVLLCQGDAQDELSGLLALAAPVGGQGDLVVAGAHQAEYAAWLSRDATAGPFIAAALPLVWRLFPGRDLRFRYLPRVPGVEQIANHEALRRRVEVSSHRRPRMSIDPEVIAASLRKKSNRSRLNRLKRHGEVRLRCGPEIADLPRFLDRVVEIYDFRQGAVNDVCPFRDDPRKRGFHELLGERGLLHVAALTVGDEVAAAHVGLENRPRFHIGIFAHSPAFAAHSPGKFLLLMLAEKLATEGYADIDLTPGGDPWKERFATSHDEVYTLMAHRSPGAMLRRRLRRGAEATARAVVTSLGSSPAALRRRLDALRPRGEGSGIARLASLFATRTDATLLSRPAAEPVAAPFSPVALDRVGDLLRFDPPDSGPSRREFLSRALERLESGQRVCTRRDGDRLLLSCWLAAGPARVHIARVQQDLEVAPGRLLVHDLCRHSEVADAAVTEDFLRGVVGAAIPTPGVSDIDAIIDRHDAATAVFENLGFLPREVLGTRRVLWHRRGTRGSPA